MVITALAKQTQGDSRYARLREIIAEKSFAEGDFKLSSGKRSPYFFDMKPTMLDPEGANLIADLILDRLQTEDVGAVGGLALGAVPIVSVVCAKSHFTERPIPAFFVRKELKGHGTNRIIDGYVQPGKRAIVIDDVTTTGGSVLKAVETARQKGFLVDKVITVVDRLEGAVENLAKDGIELVSLYVRTDFSST